MSDKLLFDEQPLLIMPQLAVKIGLHESIVLQQIHYWLEINKKADKNFKDGFYWTFNSYEEWQKQFPFWNVVTIKRIIARLKSQKLIVCGNYNKMKIDRTKWYRIDYNVLESIESSPLCQNDTMHSNKKSKAIPETKTENKGMKHQSKRKGKLTNYHLEVTAEMAHIEIVKNR